MKKDIHPKYYPEVKVTCGCGNKFTVGSTKPEIKIEICSKCHPFFTGTQELIDTAGRIEKFKARKAKAETKSKTKTPAKGEARLRRQKSKVQVKSKK